MKKGFEWSVSVLMTIILAVVMAGIVWAALAGKTPVAEAKPSAPEKGCNNAGDCLSNQDGGQCLVIYPGDFTPFCGCLVKDDCLNRRNGFCGSNEKCA